MDMYSVKLIKENNIFDKILYAMRSVCREYERKILAGINIVNFCIEDEIKLKKTILKNNIKIFLSENFPPCVFSYICKYKMCDISLNIEDLGDSYSIIIFGGSGYPVCSYLKKVFLKNIDEYNNLEDIGKGEIFNLKLENSLNQYIKHIFGNKASKVSYIKNCYELYYFKVNNTYYVLNKNFSNIINKDEIYLQNKIKKICTEKYNRDICDREFDVYLYMLSRKIPCILTSNSSIIFADSYYVDYLKMIYYLEFVKC